MKCAMFLAVLFACRIVVSAEGVEGMEATEQNLLRAQRQHQEFLAADQQQFAKLLAASDKIFGVDPRWLEAKRSQAPTRYSGNLARQAAKEWGVGDLGCATCTFKAISRVGPKEYIAWPSTGDEVILLCGADVSRVIDKAEFFFPRVVAISGTFAYTAVTGAKKTILVLDCSDEVVKPFLAKVAADQANAMELEKLAAAREQKRQQAEEDAKYRQWTSADSNKTLEAKLLSFESGKAVLQKRDGSQVQIAPSRLIKEDQQFIRDEMARRKKTDNPPITTPRVRAPAKAGSRR